MSQRVRAIHPLARNPSKNSCAWPRSAETRRRSSVPVSVRDGERRDAEVLPSLERAHAEVAVQSGSRLGSYGELDIARDDGAVWSADALGPSVIQVEDQHRPPA